ncbi:MAG: D-alanyl-D-alanine carboxypeptidase [Desulfobacterales bacterium]|nr:D-alanyl-D-alanine carboxypeptidase [Desulfobacterales bacterium]
MMDLLHLWWKASKCFVFYSFLAVALIFYPFKGNCSKLSNLDKLIGAKDAILVADSYGKIIYSKNAENKLVPASILKMFTAMLAIHHLEPEFRFRTEFYIDSKNNLLIKGYGDPLLISEVISEIAKELSKKLKNINDIIIDNSYFDTSILIPGAGTSFEPYDAPVGALCVNFNSVSFKKDKKGKYISAEPQTPLLPVTIKRIKESKLKSGRILLKKSQTNQYAGYMFKYFLESYGIKLKGKIIDGLLNSDFKLIYKYNSIFSLEETIFRMLKYSNNFIANQLFLSIGVKICGSPATLEKGVNVAKTFAKEQLKINDIEISEGSGLSRENLISPANMLKVLIAFKPYYQLLRHDGQEYYKTGTLSNVSTRAGYIEDSKGSLYMFVVMVNTSSKSTNKIMKQLLYDM